MALDRFSTALYTVSEAATCLDVPKSTLNSWAHGYHNQPIGRPGPFLFVVTWRRLRPVHLSGG